MTAVIGWGVEALLGSTLLMALVVLIRAPMRRMFGAHPAYALWALPVLRLVLPPMPQGWGAAVSTPVRAVGEHVSVMILPSAVPSLADPAAQVAVPGAPPLAIALMALWFAGVVGVSGWHAIGYRRFRARVLREAIAIDRVEGIAVIQSGAVSGPLAFGVLRRFVAFPADFFERYDAKARDLALAHEIGHHRRGDLIANWIALIVLALHWMSPVAWLAFRAFRADQEMANDAFVLSRRSTADRHAYARAIVAAAQGGAAFAVCHLHTVDDLKGRLRMLGRPRVSRTRRWTGMAGVAAVALIGLGATASGTSAAETVRNGVEHVTGVDVAASAPAAPVAPVSVSAPARAVVQAPAAPVTSKARRVVIVKEGKATTYDGAEAEAYLAANPIPVSPVPPVPPLSPTVGSAAGPSVPPVPPVPGVNVDRQVTRLIVRRDGRPVQDRTYIVTMPDIVSRDCAPTDGQPMVLHEQKDGRRVTVMCRDRIRRVSSLAMTRMQSSGEVERKAYRTALEGLRNARAGIVGNAAIPADGRAQALAAIATSILEIEADMARAR